MTSQEGEDPLSILDDYDFDLPEPSIAQQALAERDAARLMLIDRSSGRVVAQDEDSRVRDLPQWLEPGDLLVVNATRVVSARLVGRKRSGGHAEALLLSRDESVPNSYRALVKCTGRVREGLELDLGRSQGLEAKITALYGRGEVSLEFAPGVDPYEEGQAPLPPYIRRAEGRDDPLADLERYQTVYARDPGAIAAPTAGLHFTPGLFDALAARGIERAEVVLHVGAGTFRPLDREALESGRLHEERYSLPVETVEAIDRTRARGGRIVAVGTTTARVLESCASEEGGLAPGQGTTRLFIRPAGPPFRIVDALITNFHLPRSSLLMLVAAFIGREPLLEAYAQAIAGGYRFYSYGDAMLIAPGLRGEFAGA